MEFVNSIDDQVYTDIETLFGLIFDSKLLQVFLPVGFDFALTKVEEMGFDFTFLSGKLTGEELSHDFKALVAIAMQWVRDNNIGTRQTDKATAIKHICFDNLKIFYPVFVAGGMVIAIRAF